MRITGPDPGYKATVGEASTVLVYCDCWSPPSSQFITQVHCLFPCSATQSIFVAQAAITVLLDRHKLPAPGVYTVS